MPEKFGEEHLEKPAVPPAHTEPTTTTANVQDGVFGVDDHGTRKDAHNNAGMAVIEQRGVIPSTGKRIPTSKWEYITFCIFCKYFLYLRLVI